MTFRFIISITLSAFALSALVLRLLAYMLYDRSPLITPDQQDYIFDLMTLSELVFVASTFMLTYLIEEVSKMRAVFRSIIRLILFAQLFATGKELSGLNTTGEPLEKLIFCFVMLAVGYYSFRRIKRWEKRPNME